MADARDIIARAALSASLRLWRTDITFHQYPYGPPSSGIRYGLAWKLYHFAIRRLAEVAE